MIINPFPIKSGQELSENYIHHFERVQELYTYNPWDTASWNSRVEWLDNEKRPSADRDLVVEALISFNRKMGNSPEAIAQIERLHDPQALVVVGGQQAELFTGQLLIMYKAITVLQTAKAAEAKLNRPVVPIFWIAGEDHDYDEVNHIQTMNTQHEITKITLEYPERNRTSISQLTIPDWEPVIRELDESLLDTEFKKAIMEKITHYAAESSTLTELFGRMMAWLFGKEGLVLLDSDASELRAAESPFFVQLLQGQSELNHALETGKKLVKDSGYPLQAEISELSANLFFYNEKKERVLLYRQDEHFTDRKGEMKVSREQLLEMAVQSPASFSNNVMTRPLMQDYILPVLASVLGSGEIAYWGLTKKAFEAFQLQMPILIPRKGFTLVEGTIAKLMRKYELSIEDVFNRYEEAKEQWLREQDSLGLEQLFASTREQFHKLYEPVIDRVSTINPGMSKLANVNMMKIVEQIEFLEARSTDAHRSQFDAAIRQWDRIITSIYPGGKLQERTFNVLSYLNKYGDSWLKELISAEMHNEDQKLHQIVYL